MDHAYHSRELVRLHAGFEAVLPGGKVFIVARRLPLVDFLDSAPRYVLESIRDGNQCIVKETCIEGRAL